MSTRYEQRFEIAAASITGASHRAQGRGCQDGHSIVRAAGGLVAVVTDGCGSSPRSEVGAILGAALWARALADELDADLGVDVGLLVRARDRVAALLEGLVVSMPGSRSSVVRDFFLFTAVGAVIGRTRTAVFAVGDGVIGVNGCFVNLEVAGDNAPPYLAYELCAETRGLGEFSYIAIRPTIEVRSLVLATDGATPLLDAGCDEPLGALLDEDTIFENGDQLRRQLDGMAAQRTTVDWERERVVRRQGPLRDDTTIIAIRKVVCAASAGARACGSS